MTGIAVVRKFISILKATHDREYPGGVFSRLLISDWSDETGEKLCVSSSYGARLFDQFHKAAMSIDFEEQPCQCTLVPQVLNHLWDNSIPFRELLIEHECGVSFSLPVPVLVFSEESNAEVIDESLAKGLLNYLFTSNKSVPLLNQPEHSGCIFAGILKWMHHDRGLEVINNAYVKIEFPILLNMTDLYARELFSLCSHNVIYADAGYEALAKVIEKIERLQKK